MLRITPIGTIGVLVRALRRGLIAEEEALQTLDDLVKTGLRMSSAVYRRALEELKTRAP